MPKFSRVSLGRLLTCHPELQLLFTEVVRLWDCTILEGHRDKIAQELAFSRGTTTKHYPDSKHNSFPAMAVDVAPYPIDWTNKQRFALFAGHVLAVAHSLKESGKMKHDIRWGGDWSGLVDMPHYELIGD